MFKKIMSLTLCLLLALWAPAAVGASGSGGATTPSTVKVTFDADGGKLEVITDNSDPSNPTTKQEGSVEIECNEGDKYLEKLAEIVKGDPTCDDKIFKGWQDGNGTAIDNTSTVPVGATTPITITAKWEDKPTTPTTYTVHFDGNGGTGSMKDVTVAVADSTYFLPACGFTPPSGQVFAGWGDTSSATSGLAANTVVSIKANTTYYAIWKAAGTEVTISFNANGGSGTMNAIKIPIGGTFKLPACGFTAPNGKEFNGWGFEKGATSGQTVGSEISNIVTDTTYYAAWKDAPGASKTFTITFNPNGGKWAGEAVGTLTQSEGKSIELLHAPNRNGYTFAGWYTAATGGTRVGGAGGSYSAPSDITLYAQWTAKTYTVKFDLNDNGKEYAPSSPVSATVDGKYPKLPDSTVVTHPTHKDYTFVGWFTEKLGGTEVKEGSTVLPPSDNDAGTITLYARWSGIKVTLHPEPGSLPNASQTVITVTYGGTYGSIPTPSGNVGKQFLGWYLDQAHSGDKVTSSTVVEINKDHDLYASWSTDGYTVTFNTNGGVVNPTSRTYQYGGTYTPLPKPTRTGFEFIGWFTAQEGGTQVTEATAVKAENITLYARWEVPGNVTLDPNGGKLPEGTRTTISAEAGGTYPALPANLTREGYDFKGWSTKKDDINSKIESGGTVSTPAPTTLYALWSGKKYKITFDFNGASGEASSRDVIFGSKYTSLPSAHRGGYTFIGWFTAATGGTQVTTETTVTTASDHTLYARWGYNIEFNANGGTGTMDAVKATAGEATTLPSCTFTPPYDKVFSHWAIGSATGEEITGSTYTFKANTTLYAVWKDAPLTITAKASSGGTISPSGAVSVDLGTDQTFRITAQAGYRISDVLVDGKSYGPIESHVFRNVEEDHTIEAVFAAIAAPGYLTCPKGLDCPLVRFDDLDPQAWYHDAVHYCLDNVLITGVSKTTYNQKQLTDRATLAEILWRSEGCPNPVGTGSLNQPFKDVAPTKWFYKSVTWASREKLVSGYGNGNFGPSDLVTREQVATILWRHAGSPVLSDVRMPYYDTGEISDFAWDALCWATQKGIVKGKGDGILDPKGYATRAEVAQMMLNYLG